MSYTEPGLFEVPEPAAATPPSLAQVQRDLRLRWSDYHGRHKPCDNCVRTLHEAGGTGPLPRAARHTRTVKATGERVDLCDPCARPIKAADWLASPAGKRAAEASKGARR